MNEEEDRSEEDWRGRREEEEREVEQKIYWEGR
jgi:hypothetical protein